LQDDIAQVGQGIFASEQSERLGRADVGVAAIRRLWRREVRALIEGGTLKDWQRPADLVPRAWTTLAEQGDAALATTEENAVAEVIDVRPYVERDYQLACLHGGKRDA